MKRIRINKKFALIGVTLLLIILSIQLAFKPTLEAYQRKARLERQLSQVNDLSYQPAYLERKDHSLSQHVRRFRADTATFREDVINAVSRIANQEQIRLTQVPQQEENLNTERFIVQQLELEGDYFALIKLYGRLEGLDQIGLVRSVSLKLPDRRFDKKANTNVIMRLYLAAIK